MNTVGAARIDLLADVGNDVAQSLYKHFGFQGRTRFQMHLFLKDHPDLASYFKKKQDEESGLELKTPVDDAGPGVRRDTAMDLRDKPKSAPPESA